MQADSSLQGGAANFAFDLDSQEGLTQLLASVRAAAIKSVQKNELRDLIFLYINGGHDQSVRLTLEQKITELSITPVESPASKEEKVVRLPFGTSRPFPTFAPTFKPVTPRTSIPPFSPEPVSVATTTPPSSAVTPTSVSAQIPATPAQPIASVSEPTVVTPSEPVVVTPVPEVVPQTTVAPSAPTPPPPPPSTPVPTPVSTPAPVAEPNPVVSVPPEISLPVQPVAPASQPAPQAPIPSGAADQYLQRIREIKSLVNDKVGNPVNLVDINNEVGREYMGALLDAMKKLNSGTSMISAMKRLENAYQMVEKTISEHKEHGGQIPSEQKSAKLTPVKDNASPEPVPVVAPTPTTPSMERPDVVAAPVSQVKIGTEIEESDIEVQNPAADTLVPRPDPVSAPLPTKVNKISFDRTKEDPDSGIRSAWGSETDTVSTDRVSGPKTTPDVEVKTLADKTSSQWETNKASSLAETKDRLKTLNDLPDPSALETSSVEGDPLYTQEVDKGLDQLLREWPLFKKSGLFGTGPKGSEHPLFKKISGLQIPLLLAGRFEGATQEIKQSITDYMNGWRYEQGIIYEQGETFERYLRRVIRHILDLQLR